LKPAIARKLIINFLERSAFTRNSSSIFIPQAVINNYAAFNKMNIIY
jgi:hypothetical protein